MNDGFAQPNLSGWSIRELINERAASTPDGVYLIDPATNRKISYAELKNAASAVAGMIASNGLSPGDSVAFASENSTDSAIIILGIFYGGYLATAINLVAGNSTIAYVLEHSEAKLVFADKAGRKLVTQALKSSETNPHVLSSESIHENQHKTCNTDHLARQNDGLLMYTSGTTGTPKGVVLSHANLIAGGNNTALAHQLEAKDCGMCVLPLYHINALCVSVMGALVSGGSLVIPPKFSVSGFWQCMAENKCTWFSVVPTQISYLLHGQEGTARSGNFSNIRFGRSASAPLSPDVHEAFEAAFGVPIVETMGLTETAAQILSNPLPPGIRKIGSPGVPCGNDVMIADENQCELERGIQGEVLVRGPNVMRCYLKNEDATNAALTKDGWLRTGDLGRMDIDGYVYITGRLKELIIKGGENIAPREIDEALYSHPDVVEAAAFAKPCSRYGETVEAAVSLREGSTLTESQLIDLCDSRVGHFKTPERVYFLSELPKGPSGKIQRIKLADLVNETKENK